MFQTNPSKMMTDLQYSLGRYVELELTAGRGYQVGHRGRRDPETIQAWHGSRSRGAESGAYFAAGVRSVCWLDPN